MDEGAVGGLDDFAIVAEGYAFDVGEFGSCFGLFGKFKKSFLTLASYDYVDGFVVGEDFLVAVGCVWSAHDDGCVGADFLCDLADFEG